MRWRRGGLALMATVAVLGGGLAGCGNPNQGDSVAIIGDSITDFDQTDLHEQLGSSLGARKARSRRFGAERVDH